MFVGKVVVGNATADETDEAAVGNPTAIVKPAAQAEQVPAPQLSAATPCSCCIEGLGRVHAPSARGPRHLHC